MAEKPGPERAPDAPGREVPDPPQPPDMEPVIPQNDPPAQPGQPGDGEPPPIVAARQIATQLAQAGR